MATLTEHRASETPSRSLKQGQVTRSLGGKTIGVTVTRPQGSGFMDKVGAIGSQAASIAGTGSYKLGDYGKNVLIDIGKKAISTAQTVRDLAVQPIMNFQNERFSKQLDLAQSVAVSRYQRGEMSKENYEKILLDISKSQQEISQRTKKISEGITPTQRAADVSETAINALSLGQFQLAKIGAKQAAQAGGKEAIEALVNQTSRNFLESQAMKVPAVKQLVIRNLEQGGKRELQRLAGETVDQFLVRESRKVASDLLIKRPLFYQANIGEAQKAYKDILEGDYKGALTSSAWLGMQMLRGGPIGAAAEVWGIGKSKLGKLTYGNQSFIDELSKKIGDGNSSQIARFLTTLKTKAPNEHREAEKVFRILQESNLRSADNDVNRAVDNLLTHYQQNSIPLESLTPSQIYKDMSNWVKADELWESVTRKGLIPGVNRADAVKYTPVRWDAATRNAIAQAFAGTSGGPQERMQILETLANQPGAGWANNEGLMNKLRQAIANNQTGNDIAREIQAIDAAVVSANIPSKIAKEFEKLGFTIALPKGGRVVEKLDVTDTRKLISSAIKGNTDLFDPATAPQPALQSIARGLQKAGLSPEAANRVAFQKLSQNVVASLDDVNLKRNLGFTGEGNQATGGQVILSKLQSYVENKQPSKIGNALTLNQNQAAALYDIRQLTPQEVSEALSTGTTKVTTKEARQVSKAVMQGYLDTPMEFRGLGDKVVDALYRYNPLQKYYSRVQGALRYTYNPFFRLQESTETALLSGLKGGNRLTNLADNNLVWNRSRQELDDAARFLDDSGVFASSLPGEAATDLVLGRITANITNGQKRDLAGLALDIAKSKGQSLDDLVKNNPEELADALRVVVQYPKKGVLASSLARTMNTVFFPMRYNAKVTMVAGQVLAKQPPSVQKAVLHSLFEMRDWLKSEEGINWQAANADAIQLFKWITPINSIAYTMNLLSHRPDSIGEVGALGGLPLGVISQILDSQGVIDINTPYVNPKTGDVFPDYIPNTTKARAATALTDLLGSTFNYPGRILGLPGKEASLKKLVRNFIDTEGSDFDKRLDMDSLTPLQRRWVEVLKGDTSKEAIDALYNSPAPGQYNGYTLPPLDLPFTRPPEIARRTGLPTKASRSGARRAKKTALPMPQ